MSSPITNLDPVTEEKINRNLAKLHCTTIGIAHPRSCGHRPRPGNRPPACCRTSRTGAAAARMAAWPAGRMAAAHCDAVGTRGSDCTPCVGIVMRAAQRTSGSARR
jgi:hypothetical protein